MYITEEESKQSKVISNNNELIVVWKVTALWAFSEAALGGILHAFRIPFRGGFIGGTASILISLIAYFSKQKGTILKSTFLVILIKGIVSPHTPLTAYFAVFLQGFMGQLLFFNKKFFKTSALILGTLSIFLSSVQKLLILTIVFGNTLWESIDQFAGFIVNNFISQESMIEFRFSYLLVGLYLGIHVFVGIIVGLFAGKLPLLIEAVCKDEKLDISSFNNSKNALVNPKKHRHKYWWQRPTGILIISFASVMVILSYLHPEFGANKAIEVIIMIFRAIIIMIIWYFVLAPILLKYLKRFLKKKQNLYSSEITKIIDAFPHLRSLVSYCWKISSTDKGYKKIKSFLIYLIAFLLLTDLNN